MALRAARLACAAVILTVVPIKLFWVMITEVEVVATLLFAVFRFELMSAKLFVELRTLALTAAVMLCEAAMDEPTEFNSVD